MTTTKTPLDDTCSCGHRRGSHAVEYGAYEKLPDGSYGYLKIFQGWEPEPADFAGWCVTDIDTIDYGDGEIVGVPCSCEAFRELPLSNYPK